MVYFEMTLITGNDRNEFEISVNNDLYYYLTGHENACAHADDWFDITLNQQDVETIQKLCKTNEENELIGQKIHEGTIIDVLIHRGFSVGGN